MSLMSRIAQEQARKGFRASLTADNGSTIEPVIVTLAREGAPIGQPVQPRRGFPVRVTGGASR